MKKSKTESFEIDNRLPLLAIFFMLIVAIPALRIGWELITDTTGESIGYNLEMLSKGSFDSFLIPGIFLFGVLGLFNVVVMVLVFLNAKNHDWMVILIGLLVVVWLTVEGSLGIFPLNLHLPFYAIGSLIIVVGLLMRVKKSPLGKTG